MIPKLTDDAISRLPLESGRAELLEEIMSTVAPERQTEPLANPAPRRIRWVAPLAAAAVVAGLAGGTLWWQQHRPDPDGSQHVAASLDLPQGKGIVLDAPGWQVDSLTGDGLRFRNGGADLEINSYDAKSYDSYVEDREHIVDPPAPGEPVTVLGRPAQMWAYSADDHTAIREVEDGHWLEFRGSGMDRAAYLDLLGRLRVVSQDVFDASLPDSYVTEDQRQSTAEEILSEIQAVSGAGFPDGTAAPSFADGDAKDRYQFGVEVVGAYTCAWLEAYQDADSHDQPGRATDALRVLGTSHNWPILREMDKTGDYPEVLWQIADEAKAGKLQDWYREGLGC